MPWLGACVAIRGQLVCGVGSFQYVSLWVRHGGVHLQSQNPESEAGELEASLVLASSRPTSDIQ